MLIRNITRRRKSKKKSLAAFLFLAPSLIGVVIFVLIPFDDVFRRSLTEAVNGRYVGLQNYKTVLHNKAFLLAAGNTVRFLAVCIPLLLIMSLIFAVLVNGLKKHQYFYKTVFLVQMAIPVASVVLLWKAFFEKTGLINAVINCLGYSTIDFMHTGRAFYILVFSYVWKNTGYDMVLWIAGLSGIPVSLYEAAKVDGAGAYARFFYITMPGLAPTIYITAVLSIVNSFKIFREAYLISGNYPQESIYMLQHIFNNWYIKLDMDKLCAAAVLLAAFILFFILVLQLLDRRWQ